MATIVIAIDAIVVVVDVANPLFQPSLGVFQPSEPSFFISVFQETTKLAIIMLCQDSFVSYHVFINISISMNSLKVHVIFSKTTQRYLYYTTIENKMIFLLIT
jgi:hypothetical protein